MNWRPNRGRLIEIASGVQREIAAPTVREGGGITPALTGLLPKSEARNPKSETNSKYQ